MNPTHELTGMYELLDAIEVQWETLGQREALPK